MLIILTNSCNHAHAHHRGQHLRALLSAPLGGTYHLQRRAITLDMSQLQTQPRARTRTRSQPAGIPVTTTQMVQTLAMGKTLHGTRVWLLQLAHVGQLGSGVSTRQLPSAGGRTLRLVVVALTVLPPRPALRRGGWAEWRSTLGCALSEIGLS